MAWAGEARCGGRSSKLDLRLDPGVSGPLLESSEEVLIGMRIGGIYLYCLERRTVGSVGHRHYWVHGMRVSQVERLGPQEEISEWNHQTDWSW